MNVVDIVEQARHYYIFHMLISLMKAYTTMLHLQW